jgi:hypothetical protein
LDEKGKFQPWIKKKKPKLDENRIKIGENIILHPYLGECRNILLHCNKLCSQLSFTSNMKKKKKKPWCLFVEPLHDITIVFQMLRNK